MPKHNALSFLRLRTTRSPVPYDPRVEEFDDVDYSDVIRRCNPDPYEPHSPADYFAGVQ